MQSNDSILTLLLTYFDVDEWNESLQKQLTDLNNDNDPSIVSNIVDMISHALVRAGFVGTLIGDKVLNASEKCSHISIRTVDFGMHSPSYENLHPFYDT